MAGIDSQSASKEVREMEFAVQEIARKDASGKSNTAKGFQWVGYEGQRDDNQRTRPKG